jgi:glycosyltransferase involved in cell wall biosynthesis
MIKNEEIDDVFACWALPGGFVGWLLKKVNKISYSVWLLGTDVNKFINIPFFLPLVLKDAERVFSNSSDLANKVKKKVPELEVGILPTRSFLPDPVTPDNPVKIDSDHINVFFVGRLEEVKGIDIFLEIAEKVKKVRQDVTFFVIGMGSMTKIVENADANKIIKYLGQLSLGEISYYSDFADILCITSRSESMPVVYWEFEDKTKIFSFPVGDIEKYLITENICFSVIDFVDKISSFIKPQLK